jgi:hypothetical protein
MVYLQIIKYRQNLRLNGYHYSAGDRFCCRNRLSRLIKFQILTF